MTRGVFGILLAVAGLAVAQTPEGIPIADPLAAAKCGTCHRTDSAGNMEHLSFIRTTPEGWQQILKRMAKAKRVALNPQEERALVTYLSDRHGLAPSEAMPIRYDAERRIYEDPNVPSDSLRTACSRCHTFGRAASARRSFDEWLSFATMHAVQFGAPLNEEALSYLTKSDPLVTPEWDEWNKRDRKKALTGRWLVTADLPGRGRFIGEMNVTPAAATGDFSAVTKLRSLSDGSTLERSSTGLFYGGSAWRGDSQGAAAPAAPDDPGSPAHEVISLDATQTRGEGRWFWGEYQEFGFAVTLQRPSDGPTLLGINRLSLAHGAKGQIRLVGDKFPAKIAPADLRFGAGVTVRRIVSQTPQEIVADVEVAADAAVGTRDVSVRASVMPAALAIYDTVDWIKVIPDSALAGFGGSRPRGYQQFEAIGYQRGPDGRVHTPDDLNLGPIDVTWSMEVFYVPEGVNLDPIGKVSAGGLFIPAATSPNNNFDLWIIATANKEVGKNGKPLVGKAFLVVTVPEYTFGGRRYIRDLDRWNEAPPTGK
ncbi:MAG: quinohemoprotein amine dehydrogenase subunit alpha [Acidobacteriota bacterium]